MDRRKRRPLLAGIGMETAERGVAPARVGEAEMRREPYPGHL